mmetsp:Transcript_127867/g.347029  ORF Transcript_127867/g.347029 Transcript_127867/m.347029 type:complete len:211 (+) Transcript_127867:1416-2048(+)
MDRLILIISANSAAPSSPTWFSPTCSSVRAARSLLRPCAMYLAPSAPRPQQRRFKILSEMLLGSASPIDRAPPAPTMFPHSVSCLIPEFTVSILPKAIPPSPSISFLVRSRWLKTQLPPKREASAMAPRSPMPLSVRSTKLITLSLANASARRAAPSSPILFMSNSRALTQLLQARASHSSLIPCGPNCSPASCAFGFPFRRMQASSSAN